MRAFAFNQLHHLLSYSERSHSLSFVRIDENLEVDLVIGRPGLPTYLIETKSTDRVHEAHVRSVKKFSPEIKGSVSVLLSRDPISKNIDGVSCFEWRRGLREIGIVS